MPTTAMKTIDHAPQVVHEWLNELEDELGWSEIGRTFLLLRTTLHTLRDILPVAEAVDLAAQMPVLVRGIFFDGWNPANVPAAWRDKPGFLDRIDEAFINDPLENTEEAVSAVFKLLKTKISEGEITQVAHSLRKPLQGLW